MSEAVAPLGRIRSSEGTCTSPANRPTSAQPGSIKMELRQLPSGSRSIALRPGPADATAYTEMAFDMVGGRGSMVTIIAHVSGSAVSGVWSRITGSAGRAEVQERRELDTAERKRVLDLVAYVKRRCGTRQ